MPDNYKKKTKAQKQAEDAAIDAAGKKSVETQKALLANKKGSGGPELKAAVSAIREEGRIIRESNKPLGLDLPVTNVKRTKRPPADKVKVKRGGLRMTRPQGLKKAIFRRKR